MVMSKKPSRQTWEKISIGKSHNGEYYLLQFDTSLVTFHLKGQLYDSALFVNVMVYWQNPIRKYLENSASSARIREDHILVNIFSVNSKKNLSQLKKNLNILVHNQECFTEAKT